MKSTIQLWSVAIFSILVLATPAAFAAEKFTLSVAKTDFSIAESTVASLRRHIEKMEKLTPGGAGKLTEISAFCASFGRAHKAVAILMGLAENSPGDSKAMMRDLAQLFGKLGDFKGESTDGRVAEANCKESPEATATSLRDLVSAAGLVEPVISR